MSRLFASSLMSVLTRQHEHTVAHEEAPSPFLQIGPAALALQQLFLVAVCDLDLELAVAGHDIKSHELLLLAQPAAQ